MGILIDAILSLSRLGRKPVEKRVINMKSMVECILNEINNSTIHNATIKVNHLSNANADTTLINQVWVNLISNAIKYSSKVENPLIEIGENILEKEIEYYIKDNGTGFDMQYYDKLFGVFHRLHLSSEFEGTGIGLAIVNRIIEKHGGKVYANGKVNEGASFFFTLPLNE